ncbi:MAG: hypothetical protein MK135_16895, partial [Polyangiaceae bacterium]|nr:hypothetical protein [Polyangiaceae bacterium]
GADALLSHDAWLEFRAAMARYLGESLRAAHLSREVAQEKRALAVSVIEESFSDLKERLEQGDQLPQSSLRFVESQLEALREPGRASLSAESALLAIDALQEQLALMAARELTQNIALIIDELTATAVRRRRSEERFSYEHSAADYVQVAQLASKKLRALGVYGADLGEVALADLGRIELLLEGKHWDRVEAAARHLAERLHRGTPSFGAKGSGSVESGSGGSGGSGRASPGGSQGGSSKTGSGEESSSAPSDFQEMMDELQNLTDEHAQQVDELEQLLDAARRAAAADSKTADSDEVTRALRRAAQALPSSAGGRQPLRAEAALLRHRAEAFADALDGDDLAGARENAAAAKAAARRALQELEKGGAGVSDDALGQMQQALDRAGEVLKEREVAASQTAKSTTREQLEERAKRESAIAEALSELLKKAAQGEAPLSPASRKALGQAERQMRNAAQSLKSGQSQAARRLAQEAQSSLEKVAPRGSSNQSDSLESGDVSLRRPTGDGEVHHEQEEDPTLEMIRRADAGLARPALNLEEVVRRYAREVR